MNFEKVHIVISANCEATGKYGDGKARRINVHIYGKREIRISEFAAVWWRSGIWYLHKKSELIQQLYFKE